MVIFVANMVLNHNGAGGSPLFSDFYFSMKKGFGGPKFREIFYFIINFQKKSIQILFTVFLDDLEGATQSAPCTQLKLQKSCTIWVNATIQ